ncbi:MAG TPA: cytochrome c biogenesis protein CcdA [Gemmatimonadaceae bacterium]
MDFTQIAERLSTSPVTALPLLFAAGVLTSLTPCIYPMIPITAAIVGGTSVGAARSRSRVLALTLTYVAGLAVVYASLGVVAGMTGTLFGTVSSNPWLYFAMANFLLATGLAMVDVIPLRLPAVLAQRAASAGGRGGVAGAFVMGAMSGLVAAPCGAPVMGAVLTWVTTTKSAVLGFAYLLAFSLGMCALLVAVGLSSGVVARLPHAGVWMVWVKRAFAALMFGVAEYYLLKAGQLWI